MSPTASLSNEEKWKPWDQLDDAGKKEREETAKRFTEIIRMLGYEGPDVLANTTEHIGQVMSGMLAQFGPFGKALSGLLGLDGQRTQNDRNIHAAVADLGRRMKDERGRARPAADVAREMIDGGRLVFDPKDEQAFLNSVTLVDQNPGNPGRQAALSQIVKEAQKYNATAVRLFPKAVGENIEYGNAVEINSTTLYELGFNREITLYCTNNKGHLESLGQKLNPHSIPEGSTIQLCKVDGDIVSARITYPNGEGYDIVPDIGNTVGEPGLVPSNMAPEHRRTLVSGFEPSVPTPGVQPGPAPAQPVQSPQNNQNQIQNGQPQGGNQNMPGGSAPLPGMNPQPGSSGGSPY